MSFFDNIGSKASAAGQAAAEKARNFAEVNRLSGVISDHEKRISRLYFEIGQSYYERHKDDPEAEELERIAEITDTISYADLYEVVKAEMEKPSQLLEHVALRIIKAITARWPQIGTVDLRLAKDNPPMGADCKGAGVEMHFINK